MSDKLNLSNLQFSLKCPTVETRSGISLPGTELLQSSFRTEFSMWSLSRRYRRSLRRHRRFLRSYRRFLRSFGAIPEAIGAPARSPIIARLAEYHKTLLNIVKHHETHVKHSKTHVKHCDTSWTTSKTSWNT